MPSFVDVRAAHQNHRVFLQSLRDDDGKVSMVFRDFIVNFFKHYDCQTNLICFERVYVDGDGDGGYMQTNLYHENNMVAYFLQEVLYIEEDMQDIYDCLDDVDGDISILGDTYLRMGIRFNYCEDEDDYSVTYPNFNNSRYKPSALHDETNESLIEEIIEWSFDEWSCGIIHYNKDTDVLTLYVQEHPES